MDMKKWTEKLMSEKKPMPILSFPSAKMMGVSVYRLTRDAELQAKGMKLLADRYSSAAAVSMMDLSVEAEAFGSTIKSEENEVPTVIGAIVSDEDDAKALRIPGVGEARTGIYIDAIRQAAEIINDRPVFAGMIGPFSLAGRLMDVSEALVNCIAEPDLVHITLEKTTEFLTAYAKAYKEAGADGIVIAEPLSGLLSPELESEFSGRYVKKIIDAVQDGEFIAVYHNCGPNVPLMTKSLISNGAAAYHFGDAVDLKEMLDKMPSDIPVCGNISPSGYFVNGTPESMTKAVKELKERCSAYRNFVLSSGCDIPPSAKIDNTDAFFKAAVEY